MDRAPSCFGRMGNHIKAHSRVSGSRSHRGHTNSLSRHLKASSLLRSKVEGTRRSTLDGTSSLQVKTHLHPTMDSQMESSPSRQTSLPFLAIEDHSPCGYGDISLLQGESILVHGQVAEGGWWYGEAVTTGEWGYVPSSAVAPLERLESLE